MAYLNMYFNIFELTSFGVFFNILPSDIIVRILKMYLATPKHIFLILRWQPNCKLDSLVQDGKAGDPGCGSLHQHFQPYGAERCTPGPLSCCGSLGPVKTAAAGQAVHLAGGGPLSGQRAEHGRTAAAVAGYDDGGGGGDGAVGKIHQLCTCSGYSVIQKRKQIDFDRTAKQKLIKVIIKLFNAYCLLRMSQIGKF